MLSAGLRETQARAACVPVLLVRAWPLRQQAWECGGHLAAEAALRSLALGAPRRPLGNALRDGGDGHLEGAPPPVTRGRLGAGDTPPSLKDVASCRGSRRPTPRRAEPVLGPPAEMGSSPALARNHLPSDRGRPCGKLPELDMGKAIAAAQAPGRCNFLAGAQVPSFLGLA